MSTTLSQENSRKVKLFEQKLLQEQSTNEQKEHGEAVHIATMTVEEVRRYYKISRWTVSRWRKKGLVKGYKVGRKVLVDAISLESFIRSCGEKTNEYAN